MKNQLTYYKFKKKETMTEKPEYSIIKKLGNIELRSYVPYIKAEVDVVASSYKSAIYQGFNTLASYIFGQNRSTESIAMTSPVEVSQSEKIAMTKPVTVSGEGNFTVAFIMPSEYTLDTLPVPKNPKIRLTRLESHTMAAIRFSGFFRSRRILQAKEELVYWIKKQGLEAEGDFIVAGYNPPWVPGFLARNEVMIRVRSGLEDSYP